MAITRDRLREWGSWARGGGTPKQSSMYATLLHLHRHTSPKDATADVQEVDAVIRSAPRLQRELLIFVHTRATSLRETAFVMGVPLTTLRRRLEAAEWFVNARLDEVVKKTVSSAQPAAKPRRPDRSHV